jgi:lysine-N-methylase
MKPAKNQSKIQIVQPRFADSFECLGALCPEDCCSGWQITIDKSTYETYQRSEHRGLKDRFRNEVVLLKQEQTEESFASIAKSVGSNSCTFLDQGLCAIQRSLGEERLSNTCFNFPRTYVRFDEEVELSMTLACPAVAKLALTTSDAFEFELRSQPVRTKTIKRVQGESSTVQEKNELRVFAIQLMKDPGQPTWKKLIALGVLCERFDKLSSAGVTQAGKRVIDSYYHIVASGQLDDLLSQIGSQPKLQAEAFLLLMQSISFSPLTELARGRIKLVLKGLGGDPETGEVPLDSLESHYDRGTHRLSQLLADHPWFLNHALLSDMMSSGFPFDRESAYRSFVGLSSRFGIVRLMLAGTAQLTEPKPSVDDLAQVVQTFSRHYRHHAEFATNLDNCLIRSGWSSLDRMILFLRAPHETYVK